MHIKNVTLGILALTMAILRADLFDTVDELNAKYGSPTKAEQIELGIKRTYQSGAYVIEAKLEFNDDPD